MKFGARRCWPSRDTMMIVALLALLVAAAAAAEGPCDILVAAGNPCVAAHRCACDSILRIRLPHPRSCQSSCRALSLSCAPP